MLIWTMVAAAAPITERDVLKESCQRGDAKACTSVALAYHLGEGAPKDPVYAMELFKQGCEGGDAAGCVHRADAYRTGQGVRKDSKRAIELYIRACDKQLLGRACRALGEIYILGDGVSRDLMFSALYYGQGCANGDGESCVGQALGIERGDFLNADPDHARKQFQRACELHHGRGCTLLGERYLRGIEGPKDLGGAAMMFQAGCTLQEPASCRHLGRLALKGKGMAANFEMAKNAMTEACALRDYESCVDLADVLKKTDLDAAVKMAARACNIGYDAGCAKHKQLSWKQHMQGLREK